MNGIELILERVAAPAGAPFGELLAVTERGTLKALDFGGYEERMHALLARRVPGYRLVPGRSEVPRALAAYFAGDLEVLDDLPVAPGGTEFQDAAWHALRSIAPGTTATYGEQARRIGRPAAVRAVGAANGRNPIAIVLPCHRVVGKSGELTGYAGGIMTKQWLLAHERRHARH
ncbi:MAG: methylated-DNA--[protein]-cysteine S-methyltransferase [Burkholderiales bacterium]|nr:methylated-DNA--[protein]-cysteine S-methyltransferase [Burkholderiales bacterium]